MADNLGVSLRTYGHYERDERHPDAMFLAKIMDEGWSVNWLLSGKGPERLGAHTGKQPLPYENPDTGLSHSVRLEVFTLAIELVDDELAKARKYLSTEARAEIYAIVYDLLMGEEDLPEADILEFRPKAKPLVRGLMAGVLRTG